MMQMIAVRPGTGETRAIFKFRMVACRRGRLQIYAAGTTLRRGEITKLGSTPPRVPIEDRRMFDYVP